MAVEMISVSVSTKECCRTGGSETQGDTHPTKLPGPAIQFWQLSATGESICLPRNSVSRLTDRLDMILIVYIGL